MLLITNILLGVVIFLPVLILSNQVTISRKYVFKGENIKGCWNFRIP